MANNKQKQPGRRVLVTGASSGIGLETARLLASAGYVVAAASRRGGEPWQPANGNGRVLPVVMDVTDPQTVQAGVAQACELLGGSVEMVIHCAGFGVAGAAEDSQPEFIQRQLQTNLMGAVHVNAAVLPAMRAAGYGQVFIIGSVAGLIPVPFQGYYSASKAALEAYAHTLRMELADTGVQVCMIDPGDLKTGFTAARQFALPEGSPYEQRCRKAVAVMERDEQKGQSPQIIARRIVKLCRRRSLPPRVILPAEYKLLYGLYKVLPLRFGLFVVARMYRG